MILKAIILSKDIVFFIENTIFIMPDPFLYIFDFYKLVLSKNCDLLVISQSSSTPMTFFHKFFPLTSLFAFVQKVCFSMEIILVRSGRCYVCVSGKNGLNVVANL